MKIRSPDDHRSYLRIELELRDFIAVDRFFSDAERDLLRRYGQWMKALENADITPLTPAQEHFVLACKGEVKPQTFHEKVWIRYRIAIQDDLAAVAMRAAVVAGIASMPVQLEEINEVDSSDASSALRTSGFRPRPNEDTEDWGQSRDDFGAERWEQILDRPDND